MFAARILLSAEIAAVLKDLKKRAKRSINNRCNLAIFRLACCCGLRASEIAGLNVGDVTTDGPQPMLHVRAAIAKRRKARYFPLSFDQGTLDDLLAWKSHRLASGAALTDPFVCSVVKGTEGHRLERHLIFRRWRTAIAVLGKDRVRQVSVHKGRHTCATMLLVSGVPTIVIRDVLGHSNLSTTDIYLHALEVRGIQNVFGEPSHAHAQG